MGGNARRNIRDGFRVCSICIYKYIEYMMGICVSIASRFRAADFCEMVARKDRGQRSRLCHCRSLLRSPRIYLFQVMRTFCKDSLPAITHMNDQYMDRWFVYVCTYVYVRVCLYRCFRTLQRDMPPCLITTKKSLLSVNREAKHQIFGVPRLRSK